MNNENVTDLQPWNLQHFNQTMLPEFRNMTTQWLAAITMQARMIGGFFDAQAHNSAQNSLQKLNARSARDYVPGEALCQFGTLTKSLAASDALRNRTKIAFTERSQNRQSLNVNSNAANEEKEGRQTGRASDREGRLVQFKAFFCNHTDAKGSLKGFCDAAANDLNFNRDLDYARVFDIPGTFDANFSGNSAAATRDQRALFALANNLYGDDIMLNRPNRDDLNPAINNNAIEQWMDMRSVIAKRSVAENSFATIASMKTPGENEVNTYLRTVMTNLGLSATAIDNLVGQNNPSYYAQMEILTKRMYQDPRFYAELYDKPANVKRQQSSLKAISLMQQRDIYESMQRSEMLLSALLEMKVTEAQNKVMGKSTR